jgi:drug/metabolite transporter (DMT)-like permease
MTAAAAPAPRTLGLGVMATLAVLCASWGLQQVGIKLAMPEVPPLVQMAVRSAGGALLMIAFAAARRVPLSARDGTLGPGLLVGVLFGAEFVLIYVGLSLTAASRSVLFLYTAPFFVAVGALVLLPGERLRPAQWAGLGLSFAGVATALGVPSGAPGGTTLVGDLLCLGGGFLWAVTTLLIRASRLRSAPFEKVAIYQLGVSAVVAAGAALAMGEEVAAWPSAVALGWVAYQVVWVGFVTFLVWFWLVVHYPAGPLQAATSMTPLFGVAFGVVMLGEPMTPAFAAAVAFEVAGLALVSGALGRRR